MEEQQRTALAILLSLMVVIVYSQLYLNDNKYSQSNFIEQRSHQASSSQQLAITDQQPQNSQNNSIMKDHTDQNISTQINPNSQKNAANDLKVTNEEILRGGTFKVETPLQIFTISKIGGRLISVKLKQYRDNMNSQELLELVRVGSNFEYPLGLLINDQISDRGVVYEIAEGNDSQTITQGQAATLELRGKLPTGSVAIKRFVFSGTDYLVKFWSRVETDSRSLKALSLTFELPTKHSDTELERLDPVRISVLSSDGKPKHEFIPAIEKTLKEAGSLVWGKSKWLGFGDKYFLTAVVAKQHDLTSYIYNFNPTVLGLAFLDTFPEPVSVANLDTVLYFGPKDLSLLEATGFDLVKTVDLGWFAVVAYPLLSLIKLFHALTGNYGLAIVALTLLIKFIFYPLTRASLNSMKAMSELQPELQELKSRIKDSQQLNVEMMALYKRKGVNPAGGCLPILVQIPVFFGLYQALLNSIELRHAPFALWINDLSSPEQLKILGLPIPVMIILMGITMFLQQLYQPQTTMDPQQRKIMLLSPVIFTGMFIFMPMPAGLVLYWLVNNVISIVQQLYLKKSDGNKPVIATAIASVVIYLFCFSLTFI